MSKDTPVVAIEKSIRLFQGQKVILDFDLAALYGVTTSNLNKAVSRNLTRFPIDFMLLIPAKEAACLIFHNGTSKRGQGGRTKPVRAFTQEGVAMLSSVLRSKRAIMVNIAIMRAFVNLRQMIDANKDLIKRIDSMEEKYDKKFAMVFEAIKELIREENQPREMIGYKIPGTEK